MRDVGHARWGVSQPRTAHLDFHLDRSDIVRIDVLRRLRDRSLPSLRRYTLLGWGPTVAFVRCRRPLADAVAALRPRQARKPLHAKPAGGRRAAGGPPPSRSGSPRVL